MYTIGVRKATRSEREGEGVKRNCIDETRKGWRSFIGVL